MYPALASSITLSPWQILVGPLAIIVGFKFELIFTFIDAVVEQFVEGSVSVIVTVPVPDVPQLTEIECVFCPDAMVPPLNDQKKLFPEFAT